MRIACQVLTDAPVPMSADVEGESTKKESPAAVIPTISAMWLYIEWA